MSSTLIITESVINDSDLCLPKHFVSINDIIDNGFDDEINTEEDNDLVVILDENLIEEKQLMAALGLPSEFSSNRASNKRSKKKKKSLLKNTNKSNNEDLQQLFEEYWLKFGSDIVYNSWSEKYAKYNDSSYDLTLESTEELNNEMNDENESKHLWQQLWDNHCLEEYESEYNRFVYKTQQNIISDDFKFLPQMLTNIQISDNMESNEKPLDSGEEKTSSQSDERVNEKVNQLTPTTSGVNYTSLNAMQRSVNANNGSDGEEPPEERPIIIKREHEYDFMDDISEESKTDKQMDKSVEKSKTSNKKRKSKYWHQRYRLFSRFDEGIKLDNESWYSVTPERIAEHIAQRFKKKNYLVIIDAFCGSGGNTIQFALISNYVRVIAIDIDFRKIEFAKHNSHIYGVSDRIEFIVGDYMQLAKDCAFKADAVFLSPPWGGPQYLRREAYKMNMMSPNGVDVFDVTQKHISPNIGFLLPRNIDKNELKQMAGNGNPVEVEQNLVNNKIKTVTAYFGDLIIEPESLTSN